MGASARAQTKRSETVAVPERVRVVLAMLTAAAERGDPAPNNSLIATAIGAASGATAASAVALLETMGLISVERGRLKRIVTIIATGKKTGGTIGGVLRIPKALDRPKKRSFWSKNRDAILMQRIADGADFEQAAILCDCTGDQAAARFDELAADLEAKQAARILAMAA